MWGLCIRSYGDDSAVPFAFGLIRGPGCVLSSRISAQNAAPSFRVARGSAALLSTRGDALFVSAKWGLKSQIQRATACEQIHSLSGVLKHGGEEWQGSVPEETAQGWCPFLKGKKLQHGWLCWPVLAGPCSCYTVLYTQLLTQRFLPSRSLPATPAGCHQASPASHCLVSRGKS